MSSRHLVDPQLRALAESVPPTDLDRALLPAMRATPARYDVRPEDAAGSDMRVRRLSPSQLTPGVEVRIYRPKAATGVLPCILHMHSGGYVMGSAAREEAQHRPLVMALHCCLISVEYRLAPETPFPGAIEDCYAALSWVVANAAELRIDRSRIGVMGESAGGGLAAALALLVRDRAEHALAFQHLICPMLDDRTCVASDPHPFAGEFIWTPQRNHFGWSSLLGVAPGGEGVWPYAAPARADSLASLPPAYIAVGALDLFLEENLEYARRMIRSGVPVELHVYPGAYHGFQWERDADITKVAERDSRHALAKALA
ncbi:arylesterase [Nostoc sp. 3335mG]|nr:arylesterase [Nostoc sp. 3335mG]